MTNDYTQHLGFLFARHYYPLNYSQIISQLDYQAGEYLVFTIAAICTISWQAWMRDTMNFGYQHDNR